MWYQLVEHLILFDMIPHTWWNEVPFEHYLKYSSILLSHGGHLKNGCISFQQNIVRVVHLEVVQGDPLNTLIPNTCSQQPMSGGPQKTGFCSLGIRVQISFCMSQASWILHAVESSELSLRDSGSRPLLQSKWLNINACTSFSVVDLSKNIYNLSHPVWSHGCRFTHVIN